MKNKALKLLAAIAGLYHVLLGAAALILPTDTSVKVIDAVLGLTPVVNEQFSLIVKYTGAYVLVFGLLLLIFAYNPIKYRILALPILVLFGVRLLNRILLFNAVSSLYEMSVARGIFSTTAIALFFFGILITMPRSKAQADECR